MRIAITGGSGFLGRALLRRLTVHGGADRVVVFSRDEQKRHQLWEAFGAYPAVRVYAGDVRDRDRLVDLFHGCEAVVHAAARKVVTAHPDEAEEMLKTNVLGSVNVIEAARRAGVTKLVVVSSDKAVRAENVYGVSKALMEHLAVNANARTMASGLRVGVVRYGNVLGSTGSVVAAWRGYVARGQPIPMANPAMTRFWITQEGAVDLILHALQNLRGGEVLVPHLPAASLATLAEAVAGPGYPARRLDGHGSTVGRVEGAAPALPMENGSGIRQGGEKVHEELVSASEARRALWVHGLYVVPPYQHEEMWDARPWLGVPVHQQAREMGLPEFVYRSDVWPFQVTAAGLRKMLEAAGA